MRVYSRSNSSSKMNSTKEETYQIAHSLGATSNSRVIANVDYRTVGLLPGQGRLTLLMHALVPFRLLKWRGTF